MWRKTRAVWFEIARGQSRLGGKLKMDPSDKTVATDEKDSLNPRDVET